MALTAVPEKPNLFSSVVIDRPMKALAHMCKPVMARHTVNRKKIGLIRERKKHILTR